MGTYLSIYPQHQLRFANLIVMKLRNLETFMNMKTKYIFLSVWAMMMAFTLTSCDGFLNQPPYDDFTDEEYWQNEDQARTYMYGFYTSVFSGYGTGTSHGAFLMGQTLNDDFASDVEQQDLTPLVVPESDGSWSFSSIRKANYVLHRASDS